MYDVIAKPKPHKQHSKEWHRFRSQGIGGSDAAGVLGQSKYKTPYDVWLSKQPGYKPGAPTWSMIIGTRREPELVQDYANLSGKTIVQPGSLIHPQYDFIRVNLDGLIEGERIIEAKTASFKTADEWGEEGTNKVPREYFFQCQHGMLVASALGLIPSDNPLCDIFVSIDQQPIRIYTIKGDPALWELMIEDYKDFWFNYVLTHEPPDRGEIPPEIRYYKASDDEITADVSIMENLQELAQFHAIESEAKKRIDKAKVAIQNFMGENCRILSEDGTPLVSWGMGRPKTTIDTARMIEENPDLAERYRVQIEATRGSFLPNYRNLNKLFLLTDSTTSTKEITNNE